MNLPCKISGFLFWVCFLLATSVDATAIRQVSMDEMLQNSELVFEGVVTDKQVLATEQGHPYTEVSFRIIDVIKGEWPQGEIRLSFLGGETAGKKLKVQDMEYPRLGEHGIYFVETLQKRLINPLYGWSQGRFVVLPDDMGHRRIHTADGRPVTDLRFHQTDSEALLSRGTAKGVDVTGQELGREAMQLDGFKDRLRRQLQERE